MILLMRSCASVLDLDPLPSAEVHSLVRATHVIEYSPATPLHTQIQNFSMDVPEGSPHGQSTDFGDLGGSCIYILTCYRYLGGSGECRAYIFVKLVVHL